MEENDSAFRNPFRPGAGQRPPFLAGRRKEQSEFELLLQQDPVNTNLILTGLRGVGKTVLLETLKPLAIKNHWFWAGNDFSEALNVDERNLSVRLLADLSSLVLPFTAYEEEDTKIGFSTSRPKVQVKFTYDLLIKIYEETPGLESDKLKRILEIIWNSVKDKVHGIVLAYDEAQILKDQAKEKQYPLSLLLEVVQYLQRKGYPYLLVLTGLPTLFPNLVETRTYAERMFHVLSIDKLSKSESKNAIIKPIQDENCPVRFSSTLTDEVVECSGGYPYFIQFFCKEIFDTYLQQLAVGIQSAGIPLNEIIKKLDNDFYSGRWDRVTDRQKDLLRVVSSLLGSNVEFTVQDIAQKSVELGENFKPSHINQILSKLIDIGLIYKNRHGKYSFAVPMMADYVNRQKQIK